MRCNDRLTLMVAGCLLIAAAPVVAEDGDQGNGPSDGEYGSFSLPPADTEGWACNDCEFPSGWNGSLSLGGGYVSEDSFAFGHYRGLEEEGGFAILGADAIYRGDDARYIDILGEDLGIDSRSLRVEGGRQGRYSLYLDYTEIPEFPFNDTQTIFRGAGSTDQRLPGGWVRSGSTGGMTALDASLRDVDIAQEREQVDLGAELLQGNAWRFNLDYSESRQEGSKVKGGSFLFRSSELITPVDYETRTLDASAAYVRDRWQLKAAYRVSTFDNDNDAVRWENPFTSAFGADEGQLSLAPDNEFHQVAVSGSWRAPGSTTVAGRLALGRMEQDEAFLPTTVNGGISTPALPRSDLEGEVNTRTANLRVTSDLTERLSGIAELDYDERDNDTPRDAFTQVSTDSVIADVRRNRPYSHERIGVDLGLDYRWSNSLTFAGAVEHQETDRTFQDAEEVETDTVWLEARANPTPRLNVRARQTFEDRSADRDPFRLTPTENPDLRRYHLAERERYATRVGVDYLVGTTTTVGLAVEFGNEDYTDTIVGLTEGQTRSITFDVSTAPAEGITTNGFVSTQRLEAEVAGADNINGAAWTADQVDRFWTFGAGLEVAELPGKWEKGRLDFTYSHADGDYSIDKQGVTAPPFPDLNTERLSLELSAQRPLRQNVDLQLGYLVEDLREDNFFKDGVEPDTIPTVLTLGDESYDDTVQVLRVSVALRF